MTTNHEVPGSIPGSTVGIFLEGEDSHGDHGLGRSVEFRFRAPPGTTASSITTHTSLGQRNCASWASQPQKLVTLLPCPGGRTTKSTKGHVGTLDKKYVLQVENCNLFIGLNLSSVAVNLHCRYIISHVLSTLFRSNTANTESFFAQDPSCSYPQTVSI